MNEIDRILANIDKDSDDDLFPETETQEKQSSEISTLIDSLDKTTVSEPEVAGKDRPVEIDTSTKPPEVEAEHIDSVLKGTKTWNRKEPYIIPIDHKARAADAANLQKSFHFVDAPMNPDVLKLKIKQEIVTFFRRPNDHITDRYADFIYKNIITEIEEIVDQFELDSNAEKLFLYHIGPLTIYKIIKEKFNQGRYGYCYKYLPDNKAVKYFPEEFIKEIVLKWFEENINTLDIPFDSIQKYEEIKKIVLQKYQTDLRLFNARLEQLNLKVGLDKTISRSKLFQLKGIQWFGYHKIEIYKRFLGNMIFT